MKISGEIEQCAPCLDKLAYLQLQITQVYRRLCWLTNDRWVITHTHTPRPQPCHFPFWIINKRVKVRTINPARSNDLHVNLTDTRSPWEGGRERETIGCPGFGFFGDRRYVCVQVSLFFVVFSLSFVSGVWHLVAKTGEEETRPLQVEIPISPARPGEPSWVLCKHSCVGFWKVSYASGSATHRKFDYARVIIMHGQLMGQSLLLDSVPHLSLYPGIRPRLCLPMTIGLIVSVSHHLPLCVNCVFGYRIVWSSNLPDKQPAVCQTVWLPGWQ